MIHNSLLTVTLLLIYSGSTVAISRLWRGKLIDVDGAGTSDKYSVGKDDQYARYFEQKLDHFDRENHATFTQRYFLNDTYFAKKPDSPVFMCVGGEGPPLDYTVLINSVHCTGDMVEIAEKHGALMVALEHRYYGPSTPSHNWETENLKYLNSEQALNDIAAFISMINSDYNLQSTNRWITFGGSYPGMMSAMARLRFPHLVYASISSSSPLATLVDFEGYNNVVAQSVANPDVGGSENCLSVVVEGHKQIGELLKTDDGKQQLVKSFNICDANALDDKRNQEQFAGDGVVYLPAQSNDPSCTTPYCNIEKICQLLTDESLGQPIDRLSKLASIQSGGTCAHISYKEMIKSMQVSHNPTRAWIYQTCTEWGFYQTCNVGTECPYTQGLHTLNSDLYLCEAAFNITGGEVVRQNSFATAQYGGANTQGTRIMYPSGEIDPWKAASVLKAPNDKTTAFMVKGASHHFWTHPSLPTDSGEVITARQKVWDQIDCWLASDEK